MFIKCRTPRSRRSRASIQRKRDIRKKQDAELLAMIDKHIAEMNRKITKWK
jgi:hypothetical protein